jgi:hypothetical protein
VSGRFKNDCMYDNGFADLVSCSKKCPKFREEFVGPSTRGR